MVLVMIGWVCFLFSFQVFYNYNYHIFGSKLETLTALTVESINFNSVLDPEPVLTSLGP